MAHVAINSALTSLHGTVGDVVFRRHRGRVILQRTPVFTKPRTAGQLATQAKFAAAAAYFAAVKAGDPALLAEYRRQGTRRHLNGRQMAIRDFFHPPTVDGFTVRRAAASKVELIVHVYDDFAVTAVNVSVRTDAGRVVATGAARRHRLEWLFFLPPEFGCDPAGTVEIAATDHPGHTTTAVFAFQDGRVVRRRAGCHEGVSLSVPRPCGC